MSKSNQLLSLADLFQLKLYRIPDYQRGYAWLDDQLEEFWDDIYNLPVDRQHYTGVLTIEKVKKEMYLKWDEDLWIIQKNRTPYYVVDGQQRLTTILILLQVIVETMEKEKIELVNYHTVDDITSNYIFEKQPGGIAKTFLFGYEKDNPSNEYLKTKIFNTTSSSDQNKDTLYTRNMQNAKDFFAKRMKLFREKTEELFKKLTGQLVFNLYEINDELDVYISFETMNNRGKKLSDLELLKNRLIYLTTLFEDEDYEKSNLRKNINNCWTTIYEYLGKNKDKYLDDDQFLKTHWIMYFKYSKDIAKAYAEFLLKEKFIAKEITKKQLTLIETQKYVESLQESVKKWYDLHNPLASGYNKELKTWLDKLSRLGYRAFTPLIMAALLKVTDQSKIIKLCKAAEKYNFVVFHITEAKSGKNDTEFYKFARELYEGEKNIDEITVNINEKSEEYYAVKDFKRYLEKKFTENDKLGFYDWNGLQYFLYEYELHLKEAAGEETSKVSWEIISSKKSETIEHIYPMTPNKDCWTKVFGKYTASQKVYLQGTLGNLLVLNRRKNSILQNDCFEDKKYGRDSKQAGYYNGSFSEIEVAQYEEWTPQSILERGIKLLSFLEKRWGIKLEDKKENIDKEVLLFIDFVK